MAEESTTYESLLKARGIPADPQDEEVVVDEGVLSKLPPNARVRAAIGWGASFWTRTLRLETELPDGTEKQTASEESADQMMQGEFESQRALYSIVPSFIPKPIAYGHFESDPSTHFFLCDFINMTDEIPAPGKLCSKLAELHIKSMQMWSPDDQYGYNMNAPEGTQLAESYTKNMLMSSPNELFGYKINTTQGNILLDNTPCKTWEEFFKRAMKHMIKKEAKTQGPSKEIDDLSTPLLEKVIPRLLRPLETEGRSIRPCLVHGDLWHGNTSVAADTKEPYAFDSCVLWAHNEYEMGMWRASRYKFHESYVNEYQKHVPISAPEEDWDDRNALYSVRTDLLCSALYDTNTRFRVLAIEEMKRLVDKHPEGFEGFQNHAFQQAS